MNDKSALRQEYLIKLSTLTLKRKKEASFKACEMLLKISESAQKIASFAPTDQEINIWEFNHLMIKYGKLCLPVVSGIDLVFIEVNAIQELSLSKWGVLEPSLTQSAVKVDEIDLFIIPALAFDANNHRLGRGKGYYDAFISKHSPKFTLGVGYQEQMSKRPLPASPHDQKMSRVLTF